MADYPTSNNADIQQEWDTGGSPERQSISIGWIRHVEGDASYPQGATPSIILHVVDCSGRWPDAGFFLALERRFGAHVRRVYQTRGASGELHLGDAHLVPVHPGMANTQDFYVALLVAIPQPEASSTTIKTLELFFSSLRKSASRLRELLTPLKSVTLHSPRFAPHLRQRSGKAKWNHIEAVLKEELCEVTSSLYVYYYRKTGTLQAKQGAQGKKRMHTSLEIISPKYKNAVSTERKKHYYQSTASRNMNLDTDDPVDDTTARNEGLCGEMAPEKTLTEAWNTLSRSFEV